MQAPGPRSEACLGLIGDRNPWSSGCDCAGRRHVGALGRSIEVVPAGIDDCQQFGESIETAAAGFGNTVATWAGVAAAVGEQTWVLAGFR